MALTLLGSLPVSSINLGLNASLPVLSAELSALEVDLSRLGVALAGQFSLAINKPDLTALEAALAALWAALQQMLNPTIAATAGASVNLDAVAQLGIVDAALKLAIELQASFDLALGATGISAWTYSGPCSGLADNCQAFTGSWSKGLVVATENPSSWGSFSAGINTGSSVSAPANGPANLTSLGVLGAPDICTGVLQLKPRIDAFMFKLKGLKLALELQIKVSLGLQLPPFPDLSERLAALMEAAAHLLDNILNIKADIQAQLDLIQLRIDALIDLTASLTAQLSAGGLSAWIYAGSEALAGDVKSTFAGGLPAASGPNADIRALVLSVSEPSVWELVAPILGGIH